MCPHPFGHALNRDKARDSKPKPSSLGKNLPQDLDLEILTFYGLWYVMGLHANKPYGCEYLLCSTT